MFSCRLIIGFSVLMIAVIISCNRPVEPDDCSTYDYSNCNTIEPSFGDVVVFVTVNKTITSVPICVYKGKIDENIILLRDTLTMELERYELPVNEYYSVAAYYNIDGRKICAVSGGKLSMKGYQICDSICYVVKEPIVNVRLKKDLVK